MASSACSARLDSSDALTGECDQRLIGVQTRVAAAEVALFLKLLDRFERGRGDQRESRGRYRRDSLDALSRTAAHGPSRSDVLPSDDGAVVAELERGAGDTTSCGDASLASSGTAYWCGDRETKLLHEKFNLKQLILSEATLICTTDQCLIVAADNLLSGSFPARFIVNDTVAGHVDAHIGRGLVRAFAEDLGGTFHCSTGKISMSRL